MGDPGLSVISRLQCTMFAWVKTSPERKMTDTPAIPRRGGKGKTPCRGDRNRYRDRYRNRNFMESANRQRNAQGLVSSDAKDEAISG